MSLVLKNLLLNSFILAILMTSCSPKWSYNFNQTKSVVAIDDVLPIVQEDSSLFFKAQIKLYNKYYTGLIVLKKTDSVTSRLVFVTELGMKMFDYKIKNNQFELQYIFEPLNQPKLLIVLEKDFKFLLLQDLINFNADIYTDKAEASQLFVAGKSGLRRYYFVDGKSKKVTESVEKGRLFKKRIVSYEYANQEMLEVVKLKHKGLLRLKIELNKIKK